MQSVELKITLKDWIYITIIGAFFGFFISLCFYFLSYDLQNISTIIFSTSSAIFISLFSFFLITISNKFILPKVKQKFWYLISFIFSFLSGFLGFSFSFLLFSFGDFKIIYILSSFWIYISITIGFLTFLVGLILHQFISMKYKNESIKSQMLETKLKALENELNPHFLFNALNSVSELVYQDPKKAEHAIIHISKFLRNAISKDSLIKLETEISMVQTYVNIENIRFDEKIVLNIENYDEYKNIKIPKFSIQLLVENAIKHGYLSEILNIDIKFLKDKIIVENDGKITKEINFGTGLTNLKSRLKLQKIGTLSANVLEDKMQFVIELK
ncbi:two-component system sensor histidine kinase, LytS/YehU family [Arcobacter acticola]|jgi:two-component system LytT family sensor kinase|uniref:Two-component system sensor histidine kinase, LytS/YehU family n=1 Tax=Arcobacter acticola TaxID=1849015 RepID=A0A6M8EP84_9BACT|nr:histidine kinase [Arcobacter acticola]QKE28911.1 two-component system sensor histidine kinase, LytS/YehU family [Arcobacter acticola]